MTKLLKRLGIVIACLILVLLASALIYRKHRQQIVRQQRAITASGGIDSIEAVRIGGIDQWIEVRGQNVNNPILLVIHGGPGIAFIPLAAAFQGPWEKEFTVVEWDQRGAGKTYASNNADLVRRTMTVSQMEADTLDVVNYLRNRFHRQKIFALGHSWGSVLGLWLAHEHPDVIYAYVGVGQVVSMPLNAKTAYQDALQQARQRHNQQALKELESVSPYPPANPDLQKMITVNKWAGEFLGPPPRGERFEDVARILTDVASAPEYSLIDDLSFIRGQMLSGEILFPQLTNVDLTKLGYDFHAPVFLFEGRQDPYCRPRLIWDYYQTIRAPQKQFVWFDNSGHFPFFEERAKFTDELLQRVLPLAR